MRSRYWVLLAAGAIALAGLGLFASDVSGGGAAGGGNVSPERTVRVAMRPMTAGEAKSAATAPIAKKRSKLRVRYFIATSAQVVPGVAPGVNPLDHPAAMTALVKCPSPSVPVSAGVSSSEGNPLVVSNTSQDNPETEQSPSPYTWYERVNNFSSSDRTWKPTLVCIKFKG